MNAKNLKYMQLFENFVRSDCMSSSQAFNKCMKEFLNLDYQVACDMWDYLTTTREPFLNDSIETAKLLGVNLFDMFYAQNAMRCIKAINDTPSIRRAVYQYSPDGLEGDPFTIFTDMLVNNKIEPCDEILKCIIKNPHIQYGDVLKRALERVFIELLKKNPTKIEMSKKLSTLLLSYVKKIKTDERAMLEQRLREIN